jgi:hypothetical protein
VQSALRDLSVLQAAALPEATVLEGIRRQRAEMAEKQTFGNFINLLVLNRCSDTEIRESFEERAKEHARRYISGLDWMRINAKIANARDRAKVLL